MGEGWSEGAGRMPGVQGLGLGWSDGHACLDPGAPAQATSLLCICLHLFPSLAID